MPNHPIDAVAHERIIFDSVEAFQEAFAPHAGTITGDIPNYTNVEPTLQISEIRL